LGELASGDVASNIWQAVPRELEAGSEDVLVQQRAHRVEQ
jgi:hypothetical protein